MDRALHVGFGEHEGLIEIEIIRQPRIRAMLGRTNLLGTSGAAAVAVLEGLADDGSGDPHGSSWAAPSLGLYLWRQDADRSRWDTVCMSRPGWHEAVLAQAVDDGRFEPSPEPSPRWDLVPGLRVGLISRGMSREDADAALGEPVSIYGNDEHVRVA